MQKTKFGKLSILTLSLFCSVAFADSTSSASARKDSVITVNDLIRIENAKAQVNLKKDAVSLGLIKTEDAPIIRKTLSAATPPANFSVESIVGVGINLSANINYSGIRMPSMKEGSKIGPCTLKSIAGNKVILEVSSEKIAANQCPVGVWTGQSAQFETSRAQMMPGGLSGVGSPMPSPLPPGLTPQIKP